jgi:hypothetical protein
MALPHNAIGYPLCEPGRTCDDFNLRFIVVFNGMINAPALSA